MRISTNPHRLVQNLVFSSVCLSLCILLPFLTGQIPQVGNALCPMHIPVLLAGFLCGPWWAMAVGLVAPGLRYLIFSLPPMMPIGLCMSFELLSYGLISGLLYRILPRKNTSIYVSLIGAMLAGRIVWGIVSVIVYGTANLSFTWTIFFTGAFLNAIPGIIVHIILIPVLVFALQKAKIIH